MAGEEDKQATNSTKSNLHPVYTVSNIQHKVRVLDGTKVTYAQWVKLFTLHAKGYKVLDHINGAPPPATTDPTYESWSEIDAHVLQWIYGTLSDDLLARVLEDNSTALQAWTRVKNIFLNNKGSQSSAALEHEFDNLKLESMPSLDAYCQKLSELAGQLKDVDASMTEQRLVLQLVRGLPPSYDTVASYIHQTLPNFETAHRMLQLEQHRKAARDTPSSAEVLVAPSSPTRDTSKWSEQPKETSCNNHRGNGGRMNSQRGSNSRGGRNNQGGNTAPAAPDSSPTAQWVPNSWMGPSPPPPYPYPAASGWVQPWHGPWPSPFPPPQARPQSTHSRPCSGQQQAQAYITELGALMGLNSEFQATSVEQGDGQWFMDTGDSSHLTSDAGPSDWNYDTEEQYDFEEQ
ncbi:uncharacterized protein LOC141600563 [Silene latifolia]|uniref:uncharacterized protein LOC141600563 n=1 Tax=Silene latifolia TaxID=37657 RepID=UPI003D76B19E